MKLRTLTVFAAMVLLGCGDEGGATAVVDGDGGFSADLGVETSGEETAASDTGTPVDTGSTPADTMAPPADAPTMTTSMKCGLTTCDSASQECCITAGIGVCTTKGGTCAGARYSCTSKSNCAAGEVCCVSGAGTGGASCTASCPSDSTTCASNADCSGKLKRCVDVGSGIKFCST